MTHTKYHKTTGPARGTTGGYTRPSNTAKTAGVIGSAYRPTQTPIPRSTPTPIPRSTPTPIPTSTPTPGGREDRYTPTVQPQPVATPEYQATPSYQEAKAYHESLRNEGHTVEQTGGDDTSPVFTITTPTPAAASRDATLGSSAYTSYPLGTTFKGPAQHSGGVAGLLGGYVQADTGTADYAPLRNRMGRAATGTTQTAEERHDQWLNSAYDQAQRALSEQRQTDLAAGIDPSQATQIMNPVTNNIHWVKSVAQRASEGTKIEDGVYRSADPHFRNTHAQPMADLLLRLKARYDMDGSLSANDTELMNAAAQFFVPDNVLDPLGNVIEGAEHVDYGGIPGIDVSFDPGPLVNPEETPEGVVEPIWLPEGGGGDGGGYGGKDASGGKAPAHGGMAA